MATFTSISQNATHALRQQLKVYGEHLLEGGNTALWSEVIDLEEVERVDEALILLFHSYISHPVPRSEIEPEDINPEFEAFAQLAHACLHELLVHYRDQRRFALEAWERLQGMLVHVLERLQQKEKGFTDVYEEPLRDFLLVAADTGFQFNLAVRTVIRAWMETVAEEPPNPPANPKHEKMWAWQDPFLSMFNQVSEGRKGVDEFDCYENIENQMTFLPLHTLMDVFVHGLSFDRQEINEIVPLMTMHGCEDVATTALETLESDIGSLSPLGLHRLIAIRNWLPSKRHGHLDPVIRSGRKQLASQPQEPDDRLGEIKVIRHLASTIDGSGAQNIMTLVRSRHGFKSFVGVVKEKIGWIDTLSSGWTTRVECERILRSFQESVYTLDVTQDYVEYMFRQGLSWGVDAGVIPKPNFLHWVELLHDTQVNPRDYDTDDMCYLLDLVDYTQPTHFQIRQALESSAQWLRQGEFAVGWFEVGDHVEDYISHDFPDVTDQVLEHCVEHVFEPLREKWHRRLLRLAFWAHCNAKRRGPKSGDFFTIASLVKSELPLTHIPFVRDLAMATLSAYAYERED